MDIDAALFDVFGTLVDWRSSVARDVEELLVRGRGERLDPGAFADAWRGRYQPALATVRQGQRPFARLDVLHREMLDETLREFECAALEERDRDWR
jgi:2-haloacid dehalogenase